MKILGIDPGIARVGWAVVKTGATSPNAISYGCIETDKDTPHPKRLSEVYHHVRKIIATYKPDVMCVEDLFFAANAKTALTVGQSRGVILLAASESSIDVVSYTPLAVKQTICGYGAAQKSQVQHMVQRILALSHVPKPDDTADALAIALTHAYSYKLNNTIL